MKKNDIFSYSFYRDSLLRLRLFGIICAVVFAVPSAVNSFAYLIALFNPSVQGEIVVELVSVASLVGNLYTFVPIVIPIMTVFTFSFLMKRKGADFYGALPVSRGAMAVSGMLAVLTVSVFVISVTVASGMVFLLPGLGLIEYDVLLSIGEFFSLILSSLLAIVISTLAVSVTGTALNAVMTTYIFMFIPRMLLVHINVSLGALNHSLDEAVISFFDRKYNLLFAFARGNEILTDVWSFVYTILLIAVIGWLSVILFKRRPSEAATHPFVYPIARHISRILLATLVSSLGIIIFLAIPLLALISVILVIHSVIVYFVYELITGRKEGQFKQALITFPIYVGLNVLIVVTVLVLNAFI